MNFTKQYLQKVSNSLPGSKKQKRWVLKRIEEDICLHLPNGDYSKIVETWGTPEELAAQQIETMAPLEIAQKLKLQNWVKKWLLIVAICIIVVLSALVVAAYLDAHQSVNGKLIRDPHPVIIEDLTIEEREGISK